MLSGKKKRFNRYILLIQNFLVELNLEYKGSSLHGGGGVCGLSLARTKIFISVYELKTTNESSPSYS